MADSVQSLIIQIDSDASGAASELDKLATSLTQIQTAVKGGSFSTFAKNFNILANGIRNMSGVSVIADDFSRFAASMSALNELKLSTTISKRLNEINTVISSMSNDGLAKLQGLTQMLQALASLRDFKMSTTIVNQLKNIADLSQNIQGMDFTKLQELINTLLPLQQLASVDSESLRDLSTSLNRFSNASRTATTRTRQFNTVLANVRVRFVLILGAIRRVTRNLLDSMGVYGDYIETLNLFQVSMGEAAQEMYEFGKKAQDTLGIDLTQWMKAQGVFMSLGKGFGVASDRAALMSQNLTQLAYDISSFYNIDVATAVSKVQSAFAGQIRPVRELGYDISQAKLETIALSMGIDKEVKSMTQAEKSQLRYIALMTQLTHVQGDLSRTLQSPLNQLRLFQAQIDQLKRSIGLLLLPIMNGVLPYLMAMVKVLKYVIDEIAALLGYTLPSIDASYISEGLSVDVEDLTEDLDDATASAEKLKNTLASFDQINLITSTSGGNGSGNAMDISGNGFDFELPSYDFLGDASNARVQEIADAMIEYIQPALENIKGVIGWISDHLTLIETIALGIAGARILGALVNGAMGIYNYIANASTIMQGLIGVGSIVLGVTISYTGGEDIAQGNLVSGIVETVLGTGLAAIGGSLLLGPAGAVVGVALGIGFSVWGYFDEINEQRIQEINDFFFAVDDGRQSVEDFLSEWDSFVSEFADSDMTNALNQADQVDEHLNTITEAVNTLMSSYDQGLIDTRSFVTSASGLWEELANAIKEHTEAAANVIRTGLQGELGIFLKMMGVDVATYEDILNETIDKRAEKLDGLIEEMGRLHNLYDEGQVSEELYAAAMEGYANQLSELGFEMESLVPIAEDFAKANANVGVNFESYDQIISSIDQIVGSYENASSEIERTRNEMITNMQEFAKDFPPEYQYLAQQIIDTTNQYYDKQEEELLNGLENQMIRIENTVFENWDKTLNTYGLEDTLKTQKDGIMSVQTVLSDVYSKHKLSKYSSAYADSLHLMMDAEEDRIKHMYSQYSSERRLWDENIGSYEARGKKIHNAYEEYKKSGVYYIDNLKEMLAESGVVWGDTETTINNKLDSIKQKVTTTSGAINDEWANGMKGMVEVTGYNIEDVLDHFNATEFRRKANTIVDTVQSRMSDPNDSIKAAFKSALRKAKDVDINDMKNIGTNIHGKVKEGIDSSDWKTTFTNLRDSIYNDFNGYELGEDLATSMGDGVTDGLDGIDPDLDGLYKPFETFGGNIYDMFSNMGSGISQFLNQYSNLGRSFTSTFSPSVDRNLFKPKFFAQGGFPDSADLFFANENGVPEFVGSMGGKTAVATNADIVEGVSDGVYRAIRETGLVQDVRAIAKKDGKIVFAPSAEAGKVVTASVDMWNRTGGRY